MLLVDVSHVCFSRCMFLNLYERRYGFTNRKISPINFDRFDVYVGE